MIKEYLELGQIVGTHGVQGELRVNPWCDAPAFAKQFKTVYLDEAGQRSVAVRGCRPHGNVILMRLEGVNTLDEAAA
ncbi:MAG: 16S rRNA processing protein RimM, partial [Clostridia bacterium]|nr:16S rRNA processing protein RimM [Clostridia bacterium]